MAGSATLQTKAGYIYARPPPPDCRNLLATHGRTIHSGRFCCKSPVQGLELARVVKRCDLGALAPTLFTQLRRYAMPEPQQVAVVSPMLRAAVGSERWLQEQTRPEHRAGRA